MSQQSYRPLIWASSILIFCLCVGGIFYIKHTQELRVVAAQARWVNIQKTATASGIHTDFDSYIDTSFGEGPSLFSDFPALTDIFDPKLRANPFSVDHLPELKEIPSITATMTQQERVEVLRNCLTTPLPESACEQEVYQAILNVLSPVTLELEQWKSAVSASNNLGKEYFRENFFFFSVSPFSESTNLLLLRSHCNWHLGISDKSDIECVLKSSQLLHNHSNSLIPLSVAIALDLRTNDTITTILHDPLVPLDQSAQLVPLIPTFDAITEVNSAMKTEYIIQTSYLTALAENTQHPFLSIEEPLRDEPQYLLEEIRADIAEFQFHALFGPHPVPINGVLGKGLDTFSSRIEASNYGEKSEILLHTLSIGFGYYLESGLEAQLQLEASKLSASVTLYQKKHGHYPEDLSALVPEFLSKLPITPYTGSDYSYTKPTTKGEIPTITGTIHIPQVDDITAKWPEAQEATQLP